MPNSNAEPRLTSAHNVVTIVGSTSPAERLERLARKPLAPHRHELRMLAGRLRALEALGAARSRAQLELREIA